MYLYIVVDEKDEHGKMYAHAGRVPYSNNLINLVEQFPKANFILPTKTYKHAKQIAQAWNDAHKLNNCYMFDNPKF